MGPPSALAVILVVSACTYATASPAPLLPGDAVPPSAECAPLLHGRVLCPNATAGAPLIVMAYRRPDAFSRYLWRLPSVQVRRGAAAGAAALHCTALFDLLCALRLRCLICCVFWFASSQHAFDGCSGRQLLTSCHSSRMHTLL